MILLGKKTRMSPFLVVLAVAVAVTGAFLILKRPASSRSRSASPSDLQPGPIRHQKLSEALESRVRKFEPIFAEVYSQTHEKWVEGFLRDVHPEPEIAIWEAIASAYSTFTEKRQLSLSAKKEAFGLLLVRSSSDEQHTLTGAKLQHLSRADAEEVLRYYSAAPQPVLYKKS